MAKKRQKQEKKKSRRWIAAVALIIVITCCSIANVRTGSPEVDKCISKLHAYILVLSGIQDETSPEEEDKYSQSETIEDDDLNGENEENSFQ